MIAALDVMISKRRQDDSLVHIFCDPNTQLRNYENAQILPRTAGAPSSIPAPGCRFQCHCCEEDFTTSSTTTRQVDGALYPPLSLPLGVKRIYPPPLQKPYPGPKPIKRQRPAIMEKKSRVLLDIAADLKRNNGEPWDLTSDSGEPTVFDTRNEPRPSRDIVLNQGIIILRLIPLGHFETIRSAIWRK